MCWVNDKLTNECGEHCELVDCPNEAVGRWFLRLGPLADGEYMGRNVALCADCRDNAAKVQRLEPEHVI